MVAKFVAQICTNKMHVRKIMIHIYQFMQLSFWFYNINGCSSLCSINPQVTLSVKPKLNNGKIRIFHASCILDLTLRFLQVLQHKQLSLQFKPKLNQVRIEKQKFILDQTFKCTVVNDGSTDISSTENYLYMINVYYSCSVESPGIQEEMNTEPGRTQL